MLDRGYHQPPGWSACSVLICSDSSFSPSPVRSRGALAAGSGEFFNSCDMPKCVVPGFQPLPNAEVLGSVPDDPRPLRGWE